MATSMRIIKQIKKILTIKKDLKIGSSFPWGYGLSYYNVRETTDDEETGVCYPIPLNWIIAFLRGVYFRLQWHPFFYKFDPIKMACDKGKRIRLKDLKEELLKASISVDYIFGIPVNIDSSVPPDTIRILSQTLDGIESISHVIDINIINIREFQVRDLHVMELRGVKIR